jgi:DnaJ-class molecular chaperone
MFEWVVAIALTPELQAELTGRAAAELAYTTLEAAPVNPEPEPAPPRPVDPNCPTCKGTGKVRTGDGQNWTKCPRCQSDSAPAPKTAAPNLPAFRQSTTLPNAATR